MMLPIVSKIQQFSVVGQFRITWPYRFSQLYGLVRGVVSLAKQKASQTGRNHRHWKVAESGNSSRSCPNSKHGKDYDDL
jgi:hypothetical protein